MREKVDLSLKISESYYFVQVLPDFGRDARLQHMQEWTFHICIPLLFGMIGFIIALSTMNTAARYVSLFLMTQSYTGSTTSLAWISSSIPRPPAKRAVALTLINPISQLGNVAGSYVWPSSWGPTYRYSFAIW
jgi:hypothetical protein